MKRRHIAVGILLASLSGEAYSQGSGLVEPLVSPLPSPRSAAPTAAPSAAPAGGLVPASTSAPTNVKSPSLGSGVGAAEVPVMDPNVAGSGVSGNSAELDKWIEESIVRTSAIPKKVAFVVDFPAKGIPQFLFLDAKKFNQLGFFQAANAAALAWDLKLNKKIYSGRSGFDVAVSLSRANIIIHSPKVGDWSVYLVKGDRKQPIAKGPPPVGTKEMDLVDWLTAILGWDGVVLDQRGHQLLVGSTAKILSQPQLQALAIDGSSAKIGLMQNERKGSGLLSLVYAKAGMGIFDIVFLGRGVTEIPVGTKLVIEKK